MDHIFYNKDGSCTKYALACGYVQAKKGVRLYREHGCYHIVRSKDDGFSFERFATYSLTEARSMFRAACKKDNAEHTYALPRGSSCCQLCGNQLDGKKYCVLCGSKHIYS
jgi:hypothetical protein